MLYIRNLIIDERGVKAFPSFQEPNMRSKRGKSSLTVCFHTVPYYYIIYVYMFRIFSYTFLLLVLPSAANSI